ncbi:DUF4149 domain-containing protein, partial [Leptolyngbya sp. FACHB-36]|uniref:DUF4149 domain-containing protein n=1 Tax=Leptolyngbya sp. FACHB-36 TaxID=2692808 RepID=UPI001680DAB0
WLGGSLILDLVMMPTMYISGMLSQPEFITAGYSLFWVFNRVELVSAAIVLTGALALRLTQKPMESTAQTPVLLASLLLGIALAYTYSLTPHMSALGLQLNLFAPTLETPAEMNLLHAGYWSLEALKLGAAGLLLKGVYRRLGQA